MIDEKYQRKGYGKKALKLIIDYLISKGASTIHISHQVNNYEVSKLYESAGFKHTKEIEEGEVLMELGVTSYKYR